MFNFKKKILDPLARKVTAQIDEALSIPNVSDKIERLLSIRSAADEKLANIHKFETTEALAVYTVPGIMSFGSALGFLLNPTIALACVCAGLAGLGFQMVYDATTFRRVATVRQKLNQTVNDEVLSLAMAQPNEALKSPRFREALAGTFNGAATIAFLDRLSPPRTPDQSPANGAGNPAP